MSSNEPLKIALVGNPNIGKTTLFNKLCGLNQRTGNYPGVTVDKKKGMVKHDGRKIEVVDLPGINSLFPNSKDEELVVNYLLNNEASDFPSKIVLLVSALNLKRNLYLFEQIRDLNIPMVLAVNMLDLAQKRGFFVDLEALQREMDIPVVGISAKSGDGIDELLNLCESDISIESRPITYLPEHDIEELETLSKKWDQQNNYVSFLGATKHVNRLTDSTTLTTPI